MLNKLKAFFCGFFKSAASDPVSTVTGAVMVAGGAYTAYAGGMTPQALAVAVPLITKGLHSIGTDTSNPATPVTAELVKTVEAAAAIVPQALTVADHYEEIRKEAGNAAAILAAVTEGAATLSAIQAPPAAAPEAGK